MGGRYSRNLPGLNGRGTSGAARATPGALVLAWLWVGVWMLVVLRFSQGDVSADWSRWNLESLIRILGLTPQQAEIAHFWIRKGAHVVEYAVLSFLSFRAAALSLSAARAAACAMLLCLTVATLDEAHQATLRTRTGTPWDVALDVAGAALGVAIRQRVAGAPRVAAAKTPA
jgi:VanZ family protein